MDFAMFLRARRQELGLGVRETTSLTCGEHVPYPIRTPNYISRIENYNIDSLRPDHVSIDKLWALGFALKCNPLKLFAYSRNKQELEQEINSFNFKNASKTTTFESYILGVKNAMNLTIHEVSELSRKVSPWSISQPYFSQITTDAKDKGKVQAEILWAIGSALSIDPLLLYVLSRDLNVSLREYKTRNALFVRRQL